MRGGVSTFFNWDEIANETLTKYSTAQLREIAPTGVHHVWKSYMENYPDGIDAWRSEGAHRIRDGSWHPRCLRCLARMCCVRCVLLC